MRFSLDIQNDIILDKTIRSVLISYHPETIEKDDYYNFRCGICGDDKKRKSVKKAYILKREKPWKYYCHHGSCGVSTTAVKWLKDYHPLFYRNYIKELMQMNKEESTPIVKNPTLRPKKNIEKNTIEEKKHTSSFVPIMNGNSKLFDKAISFCQRRKIPENVYSKWFVANDGLYKNRIIIPYFDNKGKVYFYQGRSIYDYMEPKYLSRKDPDGTLNHIYNFYNIDNSIPVVCLEGIIDSLFVENSVGLTGLNVNDKLLGSINHKYFILDKDKAGMEKSQQMLLLGHYVFVWYKFMRDLGLPKRDKWDLNDVMLYINRDKPFTFQELKPYFTNSIYSKAMIWM
jgi:hypothetical protein